MGYSFYLHYNFMLLLSNHQQGGSMNDKELFDKHTENCMEMNKVQFISALSERDKERVCVNKDLYEKAIKQCIKFCEDFIDVGGFITKKEYGDDIRAAEYFKDLFIQLIKS